MIRHLDAARLVDSVPPHVLGRRDRGIALVRAHIEEVEQARDRYDQVAALAR